MRTPKYYEVCAESATVGDYPRTFASLSAAEKYYENRVEQAEEEGGCLEVTLNEVSELANGRYECETLRKAVIELIGREWCARRIDC